MRVKDWVVLSILLSTGLLASAERPMASFGYHSEFGKRGRDAWESYPLAQDNGYDPTLTPRMVDHTATLTRDIDPLLDGKLAVGIVRRFHFTTGEGAKISLRYRVRSADDHVHLRLMVFRGGEANVQESTGTAGEWQQQEFTLAPNVKPVTGLAVETLLSGVHKGRAERVEFASIVIGASQPAVLPLETKLLLWDEARELYYKKTAVHVGQGFTQVVPANALWKLEAADGAVKAQGMGTAKYQVHKTDAPGIWTLHVWNDSAEAKVLLLVKSAEQHGLIFDAPPSAGSDVLAQVRERRLQLQKTVHADLGSNIAAMDPNWLLPGLPSYMALLVPPSELALLDAVEYHFSGDKEALAESRAILNAMSTWPTWLHPWFHANGLKSYYPMGLAAANVVMAREYLGAGLSAEESKALDTTLLKQVVQPVYTEYVEEDRIGFNTSNWIGNTVGAALLAAISSNDDQDAGYALGLYTKDEEHIRGSYLGDGSYGEGVSYERFDLGMTTIVAAMAKRHLGRSIDSLLAGSDRNLRYTAYDDNDAIDFGDTHTTLMPSNVFAYLAAQNRDPELTRYYLTHRNEGVQDLLARLLWEKMIKPPVDVEGAQPESMIFDKRGIAALRNGWGNKASVVVMRAGANFNHNHNDEGSVVVASNGNIWLGEAGYADYYKDPSYQYYVTQAGGHNTLLVDGSWMSQQMVGNREIGVYPAIEASMLGHDADIVKMRLEEAYDGLDRYHRTVVAVKQGPVVVLDEVRASTPHSYSVMWHPMQTITKVDEPRNLFFMEHEGMGKAVRTFGDAVVMKREKAPLGLAAYTEAEIKPIARPTLVEFATPGKTRQAELVTVIGEPTAVSSATWESRNGTGILHVGNTTVEVIEEEGVIVRTGDNMQMLGIRRYARDGITLNATAPVNGKWRWKSATEGELILKPDTPCEVVLGGVGINGSKDAKVRLTKSAVVLTIRRVTKEQ